MRIKTIANYDVRCSYVMVDSNIGECTMPLAFICFCISLGVRNSASTHTTVYEGAGRVGEGGMGGKGRVDEVWIRPHPQTDPLHRQ